MIYNFLILISGLIAGCILFQTAINAPVIFTRLQPEHARPVIRAIFPILFRVMAVLGALITVLALIGNQPTLVICVGILTLVLPTVCALLVPKTNAATDAGDTKTFNKLHRISVILTMLVLLLNLGWMFVPIGAS